MSLLLGVPGRQVKENEVITWETNRIGGKPDWFEETTPLPCCGKCQREMILVTQIYCPLTNSLFHRYLHVFVCPAKPCAMQSEGWRAIRTQLLDESAWQQSQMTLTEDDWTVGQDDWGVGQDNWGDDVCDDPHQGEKQQDTLSAAQETTTDRLSALTLSGDGHPAVKGSSLPPCPEPAAGTLPGQAAASEASHSQPQGGESSGGEGDVLMDLADSGAGDGEGEADPSQLVEMEAAAVDEEGWQRMMGLLAAREDSGKSPEKESEVRDTVGQETFPAYYLNVFAEEDLEEEEVSDHVASLLKDYEQREGQTFSALLSDPGKGEAGTEREKYDRTEVKHGDRMCYKFIKKLQACPQQCIRYQWTGTPLLMGRLSQAVAQCERCQLSRVFELQLMPALVPLLRLPQHSDPQVEFGTVLVYTCSESCWSDSESYREEVVLLQHDPDQHLFK